jgi:hypothetical protein
VDVHVAGVQRRLAQRELEAGRRGQRRREAANGGEGRRRRAGAPGAPIGHAQLEAPLRPGAVLGGEDLVERQREAELDVRPGVLDLVLAAQHVDRLAHLSQAIGELRGRELGRVRGGEGVLVAVQLGDLARQPLERRVQLVPPEVGGQRGTDRLGPQHVGSGQDLERLHLERGLVAAAVRDQDTRVDHAQHARRVGQERHDHRRVGARGCPRRGSRGVDEGGGGEEDEEQAEGAHGPRGGGGARRGGTSSYP